MASFRFVLPLLALLASLALGDMCLEYPASIPKGGHCGPSANCKYGYYCDRTSVCVPLLAVNSPCLNSNECETGSCQGPVGSMICVANANPGEACDTDSSTTTPYCGTGNCFNDVCIGGLPGDSCTNSAACIPGVSCLSGTCSFIEDGSNCTTSQQCLPQSYCNTTGYCVPLKTSGFCDFSNPCADGYECVGMTSGDTFQCMKYGTQDSGLYCQTGRVCKSGRCENNKCAAASLDVCQDNGHCGWDETCTCNNVYMDTNEGYYGKCTKNACLSSSLSYDKCVYSKCKGFSSGYSGACAVVNCGKQLTKVSQCSSSSQLVAPMFTIFLATFMGFFLVKKF